MHGVEGRHLLEAGTASFLILFLLFPLFPYLSFSHQNPGMWNMRHIDSALRGLTVEGSDCMISLSKGSSRGSEASAEAEVLCRGGAVGEGR